KGYVYSAIELCHTYGPEPIRAPLEQYAQRTGKKYRHFLKYRLSYNADTRSLTVLPADEVLLCSFGDGEMTLTTSSTYSAADGNGNITDGIDKEVCSYSLSNATFDPDAADVKAYSSRREFYAQSLEAIRQVFGDEIDLSRFYGNEPHIVTLDDLEAQVWEYYNAHYAGQ
ncbi:MAG: hypothetical protein ACI30W_08275, partial [Muribaculaceae bacterium]